jgi:hypothetical protein
MKKLELKKALREKTGCTIQHTGWTCGTCFFAISNELTNQDWQALLYFRGDTKKKDLDNLPEDINASLEKILKLCGE